MRVRGGVFGEVVRGGEKRERGGKRGWERRWVGGEPTNRPSERRINSLGLEVVAVWLGEEEGGGRGGGGGLGRWCGGRARLWGYIWQTRNDGEKNWIRKPNSLFRCKREIRKKKEEEQQKNKRKEKQF